MRLGKRTSIEDMKTLGRFEEYKNTLLSPPFSAHLEKPLAYWALPADRRLPLPFLGRTLRDLLNTPPDELAATPGIGRKKMASFIGLLARAVDTDPADLPSTVAPSQPRAERPAADGEARQFDPADVSEAAWARWRASVVRAGLDGETLGRLAPSLRDMTRVIWNTPLGAYADSTLAQLRAMKTHGEKRIRAILEVFHAVDALTAGLGAQGELVARIVPRRIDRVERWTTKMLQQSGPPEPGEIFEGFVEPLLEQLRVDATPQIAALAEQRLGAAGPIASVRQAARSMHLTRARVYQLLNEIGEIMAIRWPAGQCLSQLLREKLSAVTRESEMRQFHAAVELFYPDGRRGEIGLPEQEFAPIERRGELLEV